MVSLLLIAVAWVAQLPQQAWCVRGGSGATRIEDLPAYKSCLDSNCRVL